MGIGRGLHRDGILLQQESPWHCRRPHSRRHPRQYRFNTFRGPAGCAARAHASAGYLLPDAIDMMRVMPPAPQQGRCTRRSRPPHLPRDPRAAGIGPMGHGRRRCRTGQCGHAAAFLLQPRHRTHAAAGATHGGHDAEGHARRRAGHAEGQGSLPAAAPVLGGRRPHLPAARRAGQQLRLSIRPQPLQAGPGDWSLAQVAPERAIPILLRGRSIGDSRVVCGVHNASAVEAARLLTSATMALVMGTPAYQADLAEARAELAALRSQPHVRHRARTLRGRGAADRACPDPYRGAIVPQCCSPPCWCSPSWPPCSRSRRSAR